LIPLNPKGVLPGDQETSAVIGSRIRELLDELVQADPEPDVLFTSAMFSDLYRKVMGERPDVSFLEPKYAPLLREEAFSEAKYQGAFMVLFPDSPTTKALEEQEARDAEQTEAEAKKLKANMAMEDAWLEVQGRGDEIATLTYKIRFGEQNFVKTRHNQRGLESMRKYRAGLIRDAFCPAKRAFLKGASVAEYNRRVAEHCLNEAPTDVGVGGVQKTLTAECKAAFATGC
jgi:hypothetical protein